MAESRNRFTYGSSFRGYNTSDIDEYLLLEDGGLINTGSKRIGTHTIPFADIRLDQYDYDPSTAIDYASDNYFTLIGRTLTTFSQVEMLIEQCIVKAISDRADDRGLKLASMLEFKQKVDYLINDLKPILDPSELSSLKKLHARLIQIIEFRNLIAHAKWETVSFDAYVRCQTRTDTDGFIYFRYYEFTEENLQIIMDEADKLYTDVVRFIRDSPRLSEILYDIAEYLEE